MGEVCKSNGKVRLSLYDTTAPVLLGREVSSSLQLSCSVFCKIKQAHTLVVSCGIKVDTRCRKKPIRVMDGLFAAIWLGVTWLATDLPQWSTSHQVPLNIFQRNVLGFRYQVES